QWNKMNRASSLVEFKGALESVVSIPRVNTIAVDRSLGDRTRNSCGQSCGDVSCLHRLFRHPHRRAHCRVCRLRSNRDDADWPRPAQSQFHAARSCFGDRRAGGSGGVAAWNRLSWRRFEILSDDGWRIDAIGRFG
ncbi:MAG: hypothetical protein RR784_02170, partial [Burkholderiaceae bacterium]